MLLVWCLLVCLFPFFVDVKLWVVDINPPSIAIAPLLLQPQFGLLRPYYYSPLLVCNCRNHSSHAIKILKQHCFGRGKKGQLVVVVYSVLLKRCPESSANLHDVLRLKDGGVRYDPVRIKREKHSSRDVCVLRGRSVVGCRTDVFNPMEDTFSNFTTITTVTHNFTTSPNTVQFV